MISNVLADIRYAARAILSHIGYAGIVVLTLALGIGVTVAIVSLTEQILLRPLPVTDPDGLVNLSDPGPKNVWMTSFPLAATRPSVSGGPETVFSYPMFRDLEREQAPFVGLAGHRFFEATLSTGEQPRLATGVFVSGSYFPLLGLQPALGRLLGPEDDRVDGLAESVVLSHAYWQSEFEGDPEVLGRTLVVNGVPLTIVGVAPRGFNGTAVGARPSVFVPITISFSSDEPRPFVSVLPNHQRRNEYWVHVFGRLKPGVSLEQAAAALNPLYRAILSEVETPLLTANIGEQERDAFRTRSLVLEPGARGQTSSQILDSARDNLELMTAVAGVVLLLCCANVAGLALLRAGTRGREMAVRASIGATRARLASLLLVESLVLALPAVLLSLPVAIVTLRAASRVPGMPQNVPVGLSAVAALAAIGIALVSALIVALVPVRGLTGREPGRALQAGTRYTATKGVARFRAALAAVQIALSMALLSLMFVFTQSLANIARLDLGADIDSVVMVSVLPPPTELTTDSTFRIRLEEELAAIPGVSSVGASMAPLLSPEGWGSAIEATVEGAQAGVLPVFYNYVTPDFLRTFGVRLLAGRELDDTDIQRPVVIVNQRLAERFGLTADSIVGRSITFGFYTLEVAGVVSDVRFGDVTSDIEPQILMPPPDMTIWVGPATFYIRSTRPLEELVAAVRETIARVDPTRPIANLRTVERQLRESIATERFVAGVSMAFAALATALAALGLYGVLAYSVAQRAREIGLRFALGAPAARIRRMVLRQTAGMAVIGVVLGAIAASVLGRAARSLLFGVEGSDPLAFAAAAAVLAAVMLGATLVPARRASRVDPMKVLRHE